MRYLLLTIIFISTLFSMGLPKEYYTINNTQAMKQYFFNYLAVITNRQNGYILDDRNFIKNFYLKKDKANKNSKEYKRFKAIQKRYKLREKDVLDKYLKQIDIIPTSIVLAQAAVESGWGKSRFVREANNIFGQWTWSGKGLVPQSRDKGAKHKVKIFDSLEHSVKGYLININNGWAYDDLRDKRQSLRKKKKKLTGLALVETLKNYSQKKEEYTKSLAKMIKRNNLKRFER